MNCVQLIGRLTHDPEGDRSSDGTSVATFRLAVDRPRGTSADFVTVKVWDRLADAVIRYLRRGRRVGLHGRLFQEEWTRADDTRADRLIVLGTWVDFLDTPRSARPVSDGGTAEFTRAGADAAHE